MVKDEGRGSCQESQSQGVRFLGGKESKGVATWRREGRRRAGEGLLHDRGEGLLHDRGDNQYNAEVLFVYDDRQDPLGAVLKHVREAYLVVFRNSDQTICSVPTSGQAMSAL